MFFAYLFAAIWHVNTGFPSILPLVIFYLTFVLFNLPFLAEARYRTPLDPLLISISVITAKMLFHKYARLRSEKVETHRN